jgi:hypothetical protein
MKRLDALSEERLAAASNGHNGHAANGKGDKAEEKTGKVADMCEGKVTRRRGSPEGETAVDETSCPDVKMSHQGHVVSYHGQTVLEIPYQTWGQPTRYLAARYHTGKGNEVRQSYLLLSGFWGWR